MSRKKLSRHAPCPCGSGQKYKHCCYGKGVEDELGLDAGRQQPQYPIGTVALYGPDDRTTTKIAAGVILRDGAEPNEGGEDCPFCPSWEGKQGSGARGGEDGGPSTEPPSQYSRLGFDLAFADEDLRTTSEQGRNGDAELCGRGRVSGATGGQR